MGEKANAARHLERLVEEVLAQEIFAVDFAWGYTLLERHLSGLRDWIHSLEDLKPQERAARDRALEGLELLDQAMTHIRRFAEQRDLGELDRGLAAARNAAWALEEAAARARYAGGRVASLAERLRIPHKLEREWQKRWEGTVYRHQGESRAVFTCRRCGWELTYVTEAGPGELEVPFSELTCPFCDEE